jgi:hypothetical protein
MGHKVFRVLSLCIGVCGIAFYAIWLWAWSLTWRQMNFSDKPFLEQLWFVIDHGIFLSGLPPLMLTIYFLILKKSVKANLRGLIYVTLFIPIHYYVAATTAHSTPEIYLPAQLIELTAAILLIVFWKDEERAARTPPPWTA